MAVISVIIPTFNYSEFICDAIESVFNQTFQDIEVIVVDDGSTDNTKDLLIKYKNKIKYYYQNHKGPASARNLGIKNSNSSYICFLDSDDIFMPDKLQIQIDTFNSISNNSIALLYSNFTAVNKKLNLNIQHYQCPKFKSHQHELRHLINHNFINTSTVMIKKDCLYEVGLFDEKFKYLEDYDLWLKLGFKYEFFHIPKYLVKTRSHSKNYSRQVNNLVKLDCLNEIRKKVNKY
ncbi:glycosyltransferase [Tepidibacter mesophilus]|uniref:glycosyltransferase n=1 Tax=Tepidibacter mesophilus TaxID=655607 RepID=UPI000C0776F3|nr:glycosyltransferase [Tepidibacter mesophilus]